MAVWRSLAVTTSYSSHKLQYSCCVMTESSSTIKILGFIKTRSPAPVGRGLSKARSEERLCRSTRISKREWSNLFTDGDKRGTEASTIGNTPVRVHPCTSVATDKHRFSRKHYRGGLTSFGTFGGAVESAGSSSSPTLSTTFNSAPHF